MEWQKSRVRKESEREGGMTEMVFDGSVGVCAMEGWLAVGGERCVCV